MFEICFISAELSLFSAFAVAASVEVSALSVSADADTDVSAAELCEAGSDVCLFPQAVIAAAVNAARTADVIYAFFIMILPFQTKLCDISSAERLRECFLFYDRIIAQVFEK